jgi:hypothetical protein
MGCQPHWLPGFGGSLGTENTVTSLAEFDDGSGSALFAAGFFAFAGGAPAMHIAKWNGATWSTLGSGANSAVIALAVFNDGSGPALFAGGYLVSAGGVAASYIAKWNATVWAPVGSGMDGPVYALAEYDDRSGVALYAGGLFMNAGGVSASRIAKWNGSSWAALGSGVDGQPSNVVRVFALTVFDDGSGPALYAGGRFTTAGGGAASNIAKWNGSSWSALSSGMDNAVTALAVYNDGSGPALYAGGPFTTAGGIAASNVAKWNGSSWSPLGSGIGGPQSNVAALTVFDDGSGSALFAGGAFATAGGNTANNVAKWNGSSWSAVGIGMSGNQPVVDALAEFDDGQGPALFAGGNFMMAGGVESDCMAKWGCGFPGTPICEPGAGGVISCPCGNAPAGDGLGCNNSSNTGGAMLAASGVAGLSADTLSFTTTGEKPTATSIVLQGESVVATGVVFGQGVRCVSGTLKRLYVKHATGGSIAAPQGGDLDVHSRSEALGDPIVPGTHRYYGVYYRDPTVLGGCPGSSTFNITQQLGVLWWA